VNNTAIQILPASAREGIRLAARLELPSREIAVHSFPDGEIRVTVGPAATTTILYASLDRPNEKLIALLFAAEALRRAGAKRLILLAPYLCYMRQDAAFHDGEAISQKIIGSLLAGCLDRVITVDAHLHRTSDIRTVFPGIEADNLSAMPAIAAALSKEGLDPATVLVGPDAESRSWVADLARLLGLTSTVGEKSRRDDRSVEMHFLEPLRVVGRPVLIVDDIVSCGGTMIACAKALAAAGATSIDAVITHALFTEDLGRQMISSGIRSIRSTNSVPHSTNSIALDDLFAEALKVEMTSPELPEVSE